MAIKCVLQRDFDSLQKLTTTIDTSSQNRLPYTIQGFRSPDDKKTVLHFALQTNDEEFVKALLQEISAKSDPDQVHESDTTLLSHFIAKDETDSEAGYKALIRQTVWNIDWRDPDGQLWGVLITLHYKNREAMNPSVSCLWDYMHTWVVRDSYLIFP